MSFSQSDYDWKAHAKADLVRRCRHKAEGCRLYDIPIVDFSRDELLSALVYMDERWMENHGSFKVDQPRR